MEKRVEVNIEGRVRVTSDEQSIEEAKRRAAEVETAAEGATEGLDGTAQKAREVAREVERAFEDMAKSLGQRMRSAVEEAAAGGTGGGVLGKVDLSQANPTALLSRVDRGLVTAGASLAGARTYSEIERIQGRLATLGTYLEAARQAGAPDDRIESLEEALQELTDAVKEHKESLEKEGQKPEAQGPKPPGGEGGGPGGLIGQLLERWGGAGLARMGWLGGALRFLGPAGLALGAGVMGFRMLEGALTRANQEGRNELEIAADLARQYESSENPLTLFRNRDDLLSHTRLLRLGYTARDAERYAAMLDLPGGMRGDVYSLLQFSATTGIGEEQTAQLMHQLGMSGTFTRGQMGQPLETLKLALAEGVRLGVSKSDTLQAILRVTQESAARGVQATQGTLAFNAALQQALAQTGNRLLQGQAGAQAQSGIKSALAAEGDFGLQMLMLDAMGGELPTAEELGLSGATARGYEQLARANPIQALPIALRALAEGRAPEKLAAMVRRLQRNLGGSPQGLSLQAALLQQYGVDNEQLLTILGAGGLEAFVTQAAERSPVFAEGQDLAEDVQGANRFYWQSRQLGALGEEARGLRSLASLELTGNFEAGLRSVHGRFSIGLSRFARGLGDRSLSSDADMSGFAGETPTGAYVPGEAPGRPAGAGALGMLSPEGVAVTLAPGAEYDAATRAQLRARGVDPDALPRRHTGYDFSIGKPGVGGDPIVNPFARATVAKVGKDPKGYGTYVVLDLGDGTQARFAHLQATDLKEGQRLRAGDRIGLEGQTGAATGPHLHMEMIRGGKPVTDPLDWQKLFEQYLGRPQGSTEPKEQRVLVEVRGLENIRVEGVSGPQADRIREGLEMILGAAVPQNHRGA